MGFKHTTTALVCLLLTATLPLAAGPGGALPPVEGWTGTVLLETDDWGDAYPPRLAVAADGAALAVWAQNILDPSSGVGRIALFGARYAPAVGWSAPTDLTQERTTNGIKPQVAVDAAGNGMAVWEQGNFIWAARYVAGSGWRPAFQVGGNGSANAWDAQVGMSASGHAVVAWQQEDIGGNYHIWATRCWPNNPCLSPQQVESEAGTSAYPQVEVDDGGNAVIVYAHSGMTNSPRAAVSDLTTGAMWVGGILLEASGGSLTEPPRLAMDPSGNATAIWVQEDSAGSSAISLFTNDWRAPYFDEGQGVGFPGTWGMAQAAESMGGVASDAGVVRDPSGAAVALWTHRNGSNANVWLSERPSGQGWGAPQSPSACATDDCTLGRLALAANGDMTVVWRDGALGRMYADHRTPAFGWEGPHRVDNLYSSPINEAPDMGADTLGNTLVVSLNFDGSRENVHANRLAAADYSAPAITVTEPAGALQGVVVDRPFLLIAGVTEPGAVVAVGGLSTVAGHNGAFSIVVGLQPGQNDLEVRAYDARGNSQATFVFAEFVDPLPALEANLTAAQAQVQTLNVLLEGTLADLALAQEAVAAAEARLAQVETDAGATQAELTAAIDQLSNAQMAVAALEADQGTLLALIDDANTDLDLQAQALAAAQAEVAALTASLSATSAALNATNASLATASGRIDTLETAPGGPTVAQVDTANAAASTATLVGVLGVLVGGAAMGTSIMMGRRGGGGGSGGSSRTAAHEAAHVVQQTGGKPEARGLEGRDPPGRSDRAAQQGQAAARPAGDKGGKGGGGAGGGQGPADSGGR